MTDNAGSSLGRVEAVMRRMETALLDGRWPAGARLPPERELASQYGVSRNTVREAIQRLAARGLLQSRHGTGVFVTEQLRTGVASPWGQLIGDHPALRDDILEFRRVLEGATAYFAALRASPEDVARIRAVLAELEESRAADDTAAEASADTRLHEAIALASHNAMFLHLHTSVLSMLREHITIQGTGLRLQGDHSSAMLLQQHRTLCDAICAGQPEEARTAMQGHIDFVRAKLGEEATKGGSGRTSRRSAPKRRPGRSGVRVNADELTGTAQEVGASVASSVRIGEGFSR